ncbi:unnamed protein product [Polarella glacialis]|uniref:Uncharacterized protein n=1 Tax=Polarella glacialis TaxID=89957 RepID=A0A813GHZ2_POLGL|nr:unnamed protein product [Polarella glacialis]CAE8671953.1 unnamed protein product [Polarella glacialis]
MNHFQTSLLNKARAKSDTSQLLFFWAVWYVTRPPVPLGPYLCPCCRCCCCCCCCWCSCGCCSCSCCCCSCSSCCWCCWRCRLLATEEAPRLRDSLGKYLPVYSCTQRHELHPEFASCTEDGDTQPAWATVYLFIVAPKAG